VNLKAITLEDLKNEILNKHLSKNLLVFKYDDNKFLCQQYIKAISEVLKLDLYYAEDINECVPDLLFDGNSKYLYVYDVDKLDPEELQTEGVQSILDNNINLIIVCNKIVNENRPIGTGIDGLQFNTVVFPKLLEWQIMDYMAQKCKMDANTLSWLYKVTKGDIYRIENELQKLSIFDGFDQTNMFNQINSENGYIDLNPFDIFSLTNGLIKRDFNSVKNVLHDIEYMDVEPVGLVTIMLKNVKNVIDMQMDSSATPEKLGMQPRQFNAIKYNMNKYTNQQLINVYKFLLDIDYNLKSGNLCLNNKQFLDYLICNILNGGLLV
jgi:DNA polymerase III delta subunit